MRSVLSNSSTKDSTKVKFKTTTIETTRKKYPIYLFIFLMASVHCKDVRCGYRHPPAPSLKKPSAVCARSQYLPHVPLRRVGHLAQSVPLMHSFCLGAAARPCVTGPWQLVRACAVRLRTCLSSSTVRLSPPEASEVKREGQR